MATLDNVYLKILQQQKRKILLLVALCIFYHVLVCAVLVVCVLCFPSAPVRGWSILPCGFCIAALTNHAQKQVSSMFHKYSALDRELVLEADPHTALPDGPVRDLLLSLFKKS